MSKNLSNLIAIPMISIGGFLLTASWVAAIALHVYTMLVAFKFSGFISAVITFIFPYIAQAYWVWKTWDITGDFINPYSFYVFVYLGWFAVGLILLFIGSALHSNKN
jgi:putative flippase GtrA